MNNGSKSLSINETFIIESIEGGDVMSACTGFYTNNIISCSGNTQINLGENLIVFNGNTLATIISATTYYGDGSNLTGISTQDTFVTGGTYSNGTAVFTNNSGGTFAVSGFYTGTTTPFDVFVTGGTYSAGTAVFTNNTGGTFSVTGFSISNATQFTGGTVTGATFFTNGVTATTISATTYLGLPITNDTFVTGGTYSDGVVEFVNNSGGTFNISGFTTPFTGGTVAGLTATTISATTYLGLPLDIWVTGATKSGTVATFTNNSGGTFTLTGLTDTFVTGATYSNNTFTYRNNTGGTFNVFFNTMTGLTATTISATTYQNLPIDIRVTGGTHSLTGGTTTFRNNTGGTFSISGYTKPSDDIYVTGGLVGNGPSTGNNKLTLYRNNAGDVAINNLVDISEITKSNMDELISNKGVIHGKTYKIYGCDTSLYYNGENKFGSVYTTIYLMGLEDNKLTETGVGIFYTPKYDTYPIFTNGQFYSKDEIVIWGGFVWTCEADGTYNSIDIFTLDPSGFTILIPFKLNEDLSAEYNIKYDDIIYDYENDKIIYRNENDTNIVQTTVENISYWINVKSLYNPIKAFQWGNVYKGTKGIGNQRIINSYNENINYAGLYQTNFYFNNFSYQTNVFVDNQNSYQTNFHFENKSYQSDSNIEKLSYQDSLYFTTNSYQTSVNIKYDSYQKNITLNNGSYQDSLFLNDTITYQNNLNFTNGSYQNIIRFDAFSYQTEFIFNNGSYQYNINFYNIKAVPSQQFFNFNNGSYQSNFDNYDTVQSYLEFDNGSYQTNVLIERPQTNFIFDNGSQYNNNSGSVTQENVTIKGFNRDISGLGVDENGVYFIHDLPSKTTSKLIGKVDNELIEVDNLSYDGSKWVLDGTIHVNTISATTYNNLPLDIRVTGGTYNSATSVITFTNNAGSGFTVTGITASSGGGGSFTGGTVSGATSFTNGLTANTISSTTYLGLPVSGVTGSTGISANTTNGLVTIVNTSPDQTVTITGGTNISVNGIYPNFGINFTGSTGALGDFLPLSGGTVSGGTIFTSGLTANTISNVDYINFKTSPTVPNPTGGTVYFDSNENALSYKPVTNQNDVTVNLGQESLIRVYNDLGYQINNGQVLHITGSSSGVPTVALANASKLGTSFTESLAQTSGVATHNIPSGQYGFITNFGIVRDLNTTAFTVGQEVFLSDTVDGGLEADPNNIEFTSRVSTVGYCLESNATNGKILVSITNENALQSLTQKEVNVLLGNTISTGVYQYTGMTQGTGQTINVSMMRGWLVQNTYDKSITPDVMNLYYSGGTNISVTNIASSDSTYILITSALTVTQQTTFPTPQQRRENIYLGKVNHPNRTSILNINNTVDYDVSPMSSLRDLWSPIKYINQGIIPSPNGANLSFNTSAGTLWGNGINWHNNQLNPNSVSISGKTPASFFYRTQTGGTSSSVTVIDPTKYDVGGVITSVGTAGSNDATNQRIYLYPTGVINVLYGQTKYNTLSAAIAAIQSETFIPYPNAESTGILIGVISVRNDIVADGEPLTNPDYAKFTLVSKFGESFGGTGGLSTTTLQQAYDNSTTPEIVINATLDGLSIKNGTGGADNVTRLLEGLNAAGNATSFIRADGDISGTTIQTNGFTANNTGVTATTISATTYHNLPISSSATTGVLSSTDWSTFNGKQDRVSGVSDTEISYLDGVTSSIQPQIDNLVELNFLRQNVGYIIPAGLVNIQPSFNVSPNLASWALVTSGNTATGGIGGFVRFDTTATAGTLAFRRGSFGIVLGGYQFEYTQKVRFQTNLTGQRGLWGLSANYSFSAPTNVEPDTNRSVVGVCQLSTSTNLHIIHNDASGIATTSDLGANYPCNTNIYTYYIRIKRTTSDYTITVERLTNTDNSIISTTYTTSTNIPAFSLASFSPINYITNNAQSAIASYFDGGCMAKITHQ